MPDDYDHAIAESKHLIYEADDDKVREDNCYYNIQNRKFGQ